MFFFFLVRSPHNAVLFIIDIFQHKFRSFLRVKIIFVYRNTAAAGIKTDRKTSGTDPNRIRTLYCSHVIAARFTAEQSAYRVKFVKKKNKK